MKTVFIINPAAGNGNALEKWRRFEKTLSFPYEAVLTENRGHATRLAMEMHAAGEPCLLIGFGGDGTLRELIAGAAGADHLRVGSVPAGSGNDFGRGFGSFRDGDSIERFLINPIFAKTDLGELEDVNTWQFVSSSGIGFDAEVSMRANRSGLKKALNRIGAGKLVYLFCVIRTLIGFEKFDLVVEHEGIEKKYRNVWLAAVNNQPYFGGGMKISPNSKTDDGRLELTLVHSISRLKLLLVFGTVFTGTHTRFKEVLQLSGKKFRLTADREVHRHVDGDPAERTSAGRPVEYRVSENDWKSVNTRKERG